MTIVLFILKIIGIILLSIIGLLLFLLISILFVPIRYQTKGIYQDKFEMYAKATWFLHVVSVKFLLKNKDNLVIRIFGIPVYDKQRKKRKEKANAAKATKKDGNKGKKEKNRVIKYESSSEPMKKNKNHADIKKEEKKLEQKEQLEQNTIAKEEIKRTKSLERRDDTLTGHENYVNKNKEFQKPGIMAKLKVFWKFMKDKINMLWKSIRNIEYTFRRIYDKIKSAVQKLDFYRTLWNKQETQRAFEKCKKHIFQILRNIKPRKTRIQISYGCEDPVVTADILSVYSILFPWIGNSVIVTPDFEEVKISADFYIRGRITIYIIACAVWTYLFDQDIKYLKECLNKEEF